MDCVGFILTICAFLVAGYVCIPLQLSIVSSNFDDFNCTEDINCTEWYDPVCGSDGVTYDSICHLKQEYQKHVCEIGDFNPIALVHKGNCSETVDDDEAKNKDSPLKV